MNKFQRIKNVLAGIITILLALILLLIPDEGFEIIAALIGFLLFMYGIRLLWYYFSMAQHMVGGKSNLYLAVIVLDLSLFTGSIASMNSFIILFYLLGVFVFAGFIDVLRAFEAKRVGGSWKSKLISGSVSVILALIMVVMGLILNNKAILVYGYSVSLIYAGSIRIYNAFRRAAIIYIQ